MPRLRVDTTPNPNAMKVTVATPFCNGSRIVSKPDQAKTPLSQALIQIPGVTSLFFLNDFVTVSKSSEADWDNILPKVREAMEKHPHFV